MSTLLIAALGGGLLLLGINKRATAASIYRRHEQHKLVCAALGHPEPAWQDNQSYYQAGVDTEHMNANILICAGALLLLSVLL